MSTDAYAGLDIGPVEPPRPTQGGLAARSAIVRASSLACLVRDEDATAIGAYLDELTLDELYGAVVALAAMVPVEQPVTDLLGWVEPIGRRLEDEARVARRAVA